MFDRKCGSAESSFENKKKKLKKNNRKIASIHIDEAQIRTNFIEQTALIFAGYYNNRLEDVCIHRKCVGEKIAGIECKSTKYTDTVAVADTSSQTPFEHRQVVVQRAIER